jgi:curved DNA-binding protein CbpA
VTTDNIPTVVGQRTYILPTIPAIQGPLSSNVLIEVSGEYLTPPDCKNFVYDGNNLTIIDNRYLPGMISYSDINVYRNGNQLIAVEDFTLNSIQNTNLYSIQHKNQTNKELQDLIDYYKILEIDKNLSQLEIRQKYLLLAFKYHPDKNIHLANEVRIEYENKFKMISNAFSILSDPIQRKNYDKLLESKKRKNKVFYSYHNGDCNFTISSIILKMFNKLFTEEQLQNGKEFLNIFNKFLKTNNYNYDNIPEIISNYKSFFEKKNIERQKKLSNDYSSFDKKNTNYKGSTDNTDNTDNTTNIEKENTQNQVSNIMKKYKYDGKNNNDMNNDMNNNINKIDEDSVTFNEQLSLGDTTPCSFFS